MFMNGRVLIPLRTQVLLASISLVLSGSAFATKAQKSNEAAAAFNRGKLLAQRNDYAGAISNFSKAIELNPKFADVYVQRGIARRMNGQIEQAIEDFDKAGELNPQVIQNNRAVAQAYTNYGQMLSTNSKFEEAISDFDKAIKLFADDVRPYYERAQAQLLEEDFTGALTDYNTYLTKENRDPFSRARALLERGFTKQLLGHDKDGEEDSREGLKLAGDSAGDLLQSLAFLEQRLAAMHEINLQKRKRIG